jgi:hypothetical protein
VAAFRKATGKPETRTIPCRCAVTGRTFDIVFERFSPADRFQIARIEQDDAASDSADTGGGLSGRKPQLKTYDGTEFDWADYVCPHCGNRSGTVHCGDCQETVCAGRVHLFPDGMRSFACHDACGSIGTIKPTSHVHGAAASSPGTGHTPRLPPPSATRQRLPDRAALRLPGSLRK